MTDVLGEKLDAFLAMGVPYVDCIVMKDGVCVYRQSRGWLDPEKTKPVRGNEKYNIYSCSKLITCTAALQLYEKGLFAPDDPLSLYMPEFRHMTVRTDHGTVPATHPITLRQLFTMTAGFTYDLNLPELQKCRQDTGGLCPTREVMRYLAQAPLKSEPGTVWRYSVCHDVLAALVEVISGLSFEAYVRQHIFEPAGMKNSTFLFPESRLSELAEQYRWQDGRAVLTDGKNSYRLGPAYASGGAGAVSTPEDYITFLEALRTGKLLRPDTVTLFEINQVTEAQMNGPEYAVRGRRGFGMGQSCPSVFNPRPDFGWGGAAGAYYCVDRQHRLTALLCAHLLGNDAYQAARTEIVPLAQQMFA